MQVNVHTKVFVHTSVFDGFEAMVTATTAEADVFVSGLPINSVLDVQTRSGAMVLDDRRQSRMFHVITVVYLS